MPPKKPSRKLIEILPREPLTKKARAGIHAYAIHKTRNMPIVGLLIDATLEAERMRRTQLYEWLEGKGFKWDSSIGVWRNKQ